MNGKNAKPVSGATRIEFAAAIIILSILIAVLLNSLLHYQVLAERAAVQATVRMVGMGMQIKLAELIIGNREADAVVLENENPMRWLAQKPANYGGLLGQSAESGSWYFDAVNRLLVYVQGSGDHPAIPGLDGEKRLKFRAVLQYDDGSGGADAKRVAGIKLVNVMSD